MMTPNRNCLGLSIRDVGKTFYDEDGAWTVKNDERRHNEAPKLRWVLVSEAEEKRK